MNIGIKTPLPFSTALADDLVTFKTFIYSYYY